METPEIKLPEINSTSGGKLTVKKVAIGLVVAFAIGLVLYFLER